MSWAGSLDIPGMIAKVFQVLYNEFFQGEKPYGVLSSILEYCPTTKRYFEEKYVNTAVTPLDDCSAAGVQRPDAPHSHYAKPTRRKCHPWGGTKAKTKTPHFVNTTIIAHPCSNRIYN